MKKAGVFISLFIILLSSPVILLGCDSDAKTLTKTVEVTKEIPVEKIIERTIEVEKPIKVVEQIPTGISQADYDKLVAELASTKTQVSALTTENTKLRDQLSQVSNPPPSSIQLVSVDYRVTEQNSTWWRYSYQVTIRNTAAVQQVVSGKLQYQDSAGFELDYSDIYNKVVAANTDTVISDSDLIGSDKASRVAKLVVTIER
ncbi:MAG: hypothetical protein PHQ43_00250 [Dehalococcoidales bacterium]|nr:hypothetical protein [Dehalococcoidales bacterium]